MLGGLLCAVVLERSDVHLGQRYRTAGQQSQPSYELPEDQSGAVVPSRSTIMPAGHCPGILQVTAVDGQFGIHSHRAWVSLYINGLDRGNSLPKEEGHSPSYSGGSTSDGTGKERDSC
jgi:hypothetical protein